MMRTSTPLRVGARLMVAVLVAAAVVSVNAQGPQAPLTQLQFDIVGLRLVVDPPALTVPKQIATQLNTSLVLPAGAGTDASDAIATLVQGAIVEGTLRGPSIPPTRLTTRPGDPLLLPAFALPGDYFIDGLRLVKDGVPLLDATAQNGDPATTIPIRVINEVFVTSVTSRPLSLNEIQERGIIIDQSNFQAVNFQVAFNIDGSPFTIQLPVALPTRELLNTRPNRQQLIQQLTNLNRELATLQTSLPAEFDRPGLNFSIAALPLFPVPEEGEEPTFTTPPITGLIVIPGNVAFLNQFFSVMLMVSNVAPDGTPLVLRDVSGTIAMPTGLDRVPGASYEAPGDDPLRLARVEGVGQQATVRVVQVGPDGKLATADDIAMIPPGKGGQGEFLLEGLKEGGHIFDIDIAAVLDGLPSGPVNLVGQAAGAVFVRNPTFSVTLAHPRTVRSGEPYDVFATVTNTSRSPANLVSVNLDPLGISGAQLLSDPTASFDSLPPGQAVTARFRLLAQQTGEVTASSFTGEADGGIRLFTGVGERGVPLSPNALVLPSTTSALPSSLVSAAQRVLGQAYSIATAPPEALPPDVLFVRRQTVVDRGLELAEAGQRVLFGDTLETVTRDLLVDWLGSRAFDNGFDQLMRTTEAGRGFLNEVAAILGPGFASDPFSAQGALVQQALARSAPLTAVARSGAGVTPVELTLSRADGEATDDASSIERTAILSMAPQGSAASQLAVSVSPAAARYTIEARAPQAGPIDLGVAAPNTAPGAEPNTALRVQFPGVALDAGGVVRVVVDLAVPGALEALVDRDGDGDVDSTVPGVPEILREEGLRVVDVRQLQSSFFESPGNIRDPATYGLLVAVLFNKPVREDSVETKTNYAIDANRVVGAAQQTGGRLVYLYLEKPVGGLVARSLTVRNVLDVGGHALPDTTRAIRMALTDGGRLFGQVREANGTGVPGSVLRLVISFGPQFSFTVSSIQTDAQGGFDFDFVPRIGTMNVTAQHPQTLALASLSARFRGAGESLVLNPTFLGAGVVRGRVLAADGVTPVVGASVTLRPGSVGASGGFLANANELGEYTFTGVPVGVYTVRAIDNVQASGQTTGVLDRAGGVAVTDVVILNEADDGGRLTGRVFLSDGVTPAVGFRVFVATSYNRTAGQIAAIDQTVTDATGSFAFATTLPAQQYSVVAVDLATGQVGSTQTTVVARTTTAVSIVMEATGAVQGVVFGANGQPLPGAIVAGGLALVTTDANGQFRIEGVPAGPRTIEAGDPVTRKRGSAIVQVLPGQTVNASITLEARGTITGRVLDANGNPMPRVSVRLPRANEFMFVFTNNQGVYTFPDMPLGDYTIQAPGPSVDSLIGFLAANGYDPNVAFTSGDGPGAPPAPPAPNDPQAIAAAYQNAVRAFLRVDESILGLPDEDLGGFGFNRVRLFQDAVTQVADIRFLQQGTVAGRTVDSAGRPTGASVRIRTLKVANTGAPSFGEVGRMNSDAATGEFSFPRIPRFDVATFQAAGVRAGDFTLEAANQFSPVIVQAQGQLNQATPDRRDMVLQFPSASETNGTASGIVLMPDGVTPAPAGTSVRISFGDLTVLTGADGRFVSALPIPAGGYTFTAQTPTGGLRGQASAIVPAGGSVNVTVRLLGLGSVAVNVRRPDGQVVPNATLRLRRGTFPSDTADGVTDANGSRRFVNLSEGPFSVEAEEAITGLSGRASGVIVKDGEVTATVTITASGRVTGTFLTADGSAPIPFAQITLSGAVTAYATTDANGRFELTSIPVGTFSVEGRDPATGRLGRTTGQLVAEGQVADVTIVQLPRGTVTGLVLNADGVTGVGAADVSLRVGGLVPTSLQVTTRADGSFRIEGVSAGEFTLEANDPVTGARGTARGTLAFEGETVDKNVTLEPFAALRVTVLDENGQPATNARVTAAGRTVAVDLAGQFTFEHLRLGTYPVTAISLADSFNGGTARGVLDDANETVDVTVRLRGVAPVTVRVVASDGATPVASARVTLNAEGSFGNEPTGPTAATLVGFTDGAGLVTFPSVPLGDYSARGESGPLAGLATGATPGVGQASQVTVTLGASAGISGRVLLPDGITPAARSLVTLNFQSQSGLQTGVVQITTDLTGTFSFAGIPLGSFSLGAFEVVSSGVRTVTGALTIDGQTLALGDVALDNTGPRVTAVSPADGSTGANPASPVVVTFSEPMLAASFQANTVTLLDGATPVAGNVSVAADRRSVTFTPNQALRSGGRFTVSVRGAPDGPRDESNIAMVDPFVSTFTVRDVLPPTVLSFFPAPTAREVVPEAVMRVTFSEPVAGATLVLRSSTSQVVPAQTSLTLGNTVAVLAPVDFLPANETFTLNVSNVTDLAGNALVGGAQTISFFTVDTLAPLVTALNLQGVTRAGATLTFTPTLANATDLARVEYVAGEVTRILTATPFAASFTVPTGATEFVVSARAVDQVGNRSAAFPLVVPIAQNQAPTVQLSNVSGQLVVPQGASLVFDVTATDDVGLAQVLFSAVGAATANVQDAIAGAPTTTTRRYTVTVPADAAPGAAITVQAAAVDTGGLQTAATSLALTVRDGVAPVVTMTAPAAGAQAVPGQLLTVTVTATDTGSVTSVSLVCNPALVGCEVRSVTPAQTSTTQTFAVTVPGTLNAPATLNLVATATDAAGNQGQVGRAVPVADVVAPSLTSLVTTSGSTRVLAGATVTLRADVADNVGVVAVDFTTAGALVSNGSSPVAPPLTSGTTTFTLALPAGAANGSTITVNALARDAAGNASGPQALLLTVGDTQAPTVSLTQPPAGTVFAPGDSMFVQSGATDDVAVASIVLRVRGAVTFDETRTFTPAVTPAQATFTVPVPVAATPGAVTITVQSADAAGNLSAEVSREVTVRDAAAPAVSITNPAAGASIDPRVPLPVTVTATDATGVSEVVLVATGELTANVVRPLTPAQPAATEVFSLTFAAPPVAGGAVTLTGQARDTAGNLGTSTVVTVNVQDVVPPTVATVSPTDGATGVAAAASATVTFSEPMTRASLTAASVQLLAGATVVPATLAVAADDRSVTVTPSAALSINTLYTVRVDASVRDRNNNAMAAPFVSTFRTVSPDSTSPRVVATDPAAGAVGVGTAAPISVTFTEPVAPASVTPASFRVSIGGVPVTGAFSFADGGATARFTPSPELPFDAVVVVELTNGMTDTSGNPLVNADGTPIVSPITFTFVTGQFAIVNPAGATVLENRPVTLQANGAATLNIASVVFTVNGVALPAVTAPFTQVVRVPLASTSPTFTVVASARNASNVQIATATRVYQILPSLSGTPSVLGLARGANGSVRFSLSAPAAENLALAVTAVDPAVVTVTTPNVVIPAGQVSVDVAITSCVACPFDPVPRVGAAAGNTAIVATSTRGTAAVTVSVSDPIPGQAINGVSVPVGVAVAQPPSAGFLVVGIGSASTSTVQLLAAPNAGAPIPVTVTSSNPSVATATATPVGAGGQTSTLSVTSGAQGVATLTLRAGDVVRAVTIVVGAPTNNLPPVVALPVGIAVAQAPSAGFLIVGIGGESTNTLQLLAAPNAGAPLPVTVTSSNDAVATGTATAIGSGSQTTSLSITTGVEGVATLTLRAGTTVRTVTVVVGAPTNNLPPVVGLPVGIAVAQAPSAGFLVVGIGGASTNSLQLLATPNTGAPLPVTVTSSNAAVATGTASDVASGAQTTVLSIATGVEGTATLTLRAGTAVRTVTVVVGAPTNNVPPVTTQPVGISVLAARGQDVGRVIAPSGAGLNATLGVQLLTAPQASPVPVTVTSSNPAVAFAGNGFVPAGETVMPVPLTTTGVAGVAVLTFDVGGQRMQLMVVVGNPPASERPAVTSPVIGVRVN